MGAKTCIYRIWQWTWGFLQSLAGFVLMLVMRVRFKAVSERYRHSILTRIDARRTRAVGCVSLGMYIFITATKEFEEREPERLRRVIRHEYGHTLQSLILGPLYLFAVGLPSFIWNMYYHSSRGDALRERGVSYYDRYPEGWATRCGERNLGDGHE